MEGEWNEIKGGAHEKELKCKWEKESGCKGKSKVYRRCFMRKKATKTD